MKTWIVVRIEGDGWYLCRWCGNHYESEAKGKPDDLKKIADQLNKE